MTPKYFTAGFGKTVAECEVICSKKGTHMVTKSRKGTHGCRVQLEENQFNKIKEVEMVKATHGDENDLRIYFNAP